jgi:hypothetical protein
MLAKHNTEHGRGLGVFRWVVERTLLHDSNKASCSMPSMPPGSLRIHTDSIFYGGAVFHKGGRRNSDPTYRSATTGRRDRETKLKLPSQGHETTRTATD